jgi:hypothetical protein
MLPTVTANHTAARLSVLLYTFDINIILAQNKYE